MKKLIIAALLLLVWVGSAMGYISTVDNGTTIVVTCPDDTITFTIATENAVLKESNSLRAHIQDDNGHWYVYSGMMFNYGTAQTGMSGNDYSRNVITGNWSWYPLNSANNTNASNITTALQDTTIADPTTGSWVDDLVIPANVGVDGFASDGALHVEPSSKEAEFTNDITRHKQAVVFEDPHIYTGDTVSGATDHLVGYWPCDDNAASTTIVASVGSNGTLQGGDNTEDKDNADAVQGTSLLMNGTDDYLDFDSALGDLADTDKFTVSFWFKPNFAYNVGSDEGIFEISDGTDVVQLEYNATTDNFILTVNLTSSATISTSAYTSDAELQRWHHCMIAIDASQEVAVLVMDGQVVGVDNTAQAWGSTPNEFTIGYDGNSYGPVYVDNVVLYDGALLPYGAYFTGNGSVDTDVAHDDILALVKGDESDSDSLKIGAGTITVTNATHGTGPDGVADSAFQVDATSEIVSIACVDGTNIDNDQGQISFWYRSLGAPVSAYCNYFCHSSGYRKLTLDRSASDTSTRFFIGDSEASFTTTDFNDDNWHYITAAWSTNFRELFVDGVSQGTSTTSFTPDALSSGTLVIGNRYDHHQQPQHSPNPDDNGQAGACTLD
jgi:hypothetical protein